MNEFIFLLVEDNYGDQKLVARALALGKRGTHLEILGNGDSALSYLFKEGKYHSATEPDLIVLDLNLPRKNGLEILKRLKQKHALAKIPVIIWTGAKVPLDEKVFGADLYIAKPNDLQKYMNTVLAFDDFGRQMRSSPREKERHLETLCRAVGSDLERM